MQIITGKQVLTDGNVYRNTSIEIQDGRIAQVREATEAELANAHSALIPGFIDVQVNGGGGKLFNQDPSAASLTTILHAHRQHGTTAMLPTLITDSFETMNQAATTIAQARRAQMPGVLGVHFEGPWLSTAKKGVHSEAYIRAPSDNELAVLETADLGEVMITVAPETVSPALIRDLTARGVRVFLGHSNATATQAQAALDAGAVGFTHLFNAMSAMASRAPGMVGVALADADSYAGIIVDGYHVDPIACRAAFRAKGSQRMMLVTDAMALAATTLTDVPFFDTRIQREGHRLTTPDGTLAGSCLTMIEAVRNTVALCGMSLADAVAMATCTPASMLGLQNQWGSLQSGAVADVLALDDNLALTHVWQAGALVES
ncbi:N-acetylglucosamine-6-phosphate deacetylase [Alteromonas sp. ASW11-19]|uniref:N-acetylgalactosamine-6-phosphate deacetylase n=1 Tax=Alteromonas salexigens TaxID=2982530 RepID=A0ABT2VJM9_9ALTE|nr:N-acetylglucosamine-6-phosphate deacetylase [Alteromonas salexigens]MCU7553215.1 N-acetylglucosamine-6-phosphate deacetylase [Alteromonas salexigens]